MHWLNQYLFRKRRYEDLALSIKEHLEERIGELMDDGVSRKDAENTAHREFGNVTLLEERSRQVWQWPTVESFWADIRFALRQLRKAPGFTATAVLTLSLGIAVNATMFSLVSAFLLSRPPGRNPEKIVVVSSVNLNQSDHGDTYPVSVPNYLVWRQHTRMFAQIAAADENRTASLAGQGETVAVPYAAVSPNYFKVFDISPQLGRSFAQEEDQPGRAHVAILSHALWSGRFASDPSVIGRSIRLNREDYVVIGVMPASFRLLGFIPQLWTPLVLSPEDQTAGARKDRSLYLFARLAPGITLPMARADLTILARRSEAEFPAIERRWGASARTLPDFVVYNFGIRTALAVLMTTVSFVLLIACANVSGLLLTRAAGRGKELAIRISIGASRVRIVRQLVTEGFVVAILGGSIGLLLSYIGIHLVRANLSFSEEISSVPVTLDANVLLFVAAISLVSAALSSFVPALKSAQADANIGLKNESRTASAGRSQRRLRAALVCGEVAVALFLLTGTSILIRGVYLFDHQPLGFQSDHLLTATMALDPAHYSDASHQLLFVRDLISRLRQVPQVKDAAIASNLPATGATYVAVTLEGEREKPSNEQRSALDIVATADYLQTIGIPVLRGRTFSEMDNGNAPRVVLVNQQFVRRYLQGKDPLRVRLKLETKGAGLSWSEIVGVVGDVKTFSEDPITGPELYEPFSQRPVSSFAVVLRTEVEPNDLIPVLRRTVSQLDTELPLARAMSMDSVINSQRNGNPLFTRILGTFAFLALVLAAIGIYGLVSYSVGQRTHEIGIRMAVGAQSTDILQMILQEGFKTALFGSAIGLLIALPLPKLFDSIFQGVHFGAPALHLIALVAILLLVGLATCIPALRATHVDPQTALRNQ